MLRNRVASSSFASSAAFALSLVTFSARGEVVTLQHDVLTDNTDADAICGFAIGERLGVRFTPPAYPAKLLKARIMLTSFP